MKASISHPTGNQNVRAAILGLADAGIATAFHTAIATFPGDFLHKLSYYKPFSELSRRGFDPRLKSLTKTWPWYEVIRLISAKAGFGSLVRHEKSPFSIDAIYKNIDGRVASHLPFAVKEGTNAVYAYEDGALISFREAKKLGLQCLYDLPIGYWRCGHRILKAEQEKWPAWIPTLKGFQDSKIKLDRKDEELKLADHIFVASQFTARSLSEYPGKLAPIEVIPYGFPKICTTIYKRSLLGNRKLKLLFIGGLSQRKGIAYLFEAVEYLKNHVELTLVGTKSSFDCPALNDALAKHKWIPSLPHKDILKLMHSQDVLVFPSLFEGFGLVITEAMSQGTPVITTERTAGPDLIVNDQNGWIIEAGSTESLITAIENLLYNSKIISEVGRVAIETARLRPWEVYGKELAEAILRM